MVILLTLDVAEFDNFILLLNTIEFDFLLFKLIKIVYIIKKIQKKIN